MKIGKIDIVFLIIYIVILIQLVLTTDFTISWIGENPSKYEICWDRVANVLLYVIMLPVTYFGIRWFYQKKKTKI